MGLTYQDLADLNDQALAWLNAVANVRIHGTTHEIPFARLALEGLQPFPEQVVYDTSRISYRRSSRDCLISYAGNFYSVPAAYVCQQLMVKETPDGDVVIFSSEGDEVAHHRLVTGRHQRAVRPEHYAGLRAVASRSKRAGAVQTVPPPSPLAEWLAAPLVETRSLGIYDELVEGIR